MPVNCQCGECAIMVVRSGAVTRAMAHRTIQQLRGVNANLVGVALNGVPILFGTLFARFEQRAGGAGKTQVVYLFDPGDGEILRRFNVAEDIMREGKRTGTRRHVACPWIVGDLLVVPAEMGISACSINKAE